MSLWGIRMSSDRSVTVPAHLLERVLQPLEFNGGDGVCPGCGRQTPCTSHAYDCPVPELQQALQSAAPAPAQEAEAEIEGIKAALAGHVGTHNPYLYRAGEEERREAWWRGNGQIVRLKQEEYQRGSAAGMQFWGSKTGQTDLARALGIDVHAAQKAGVDLGMLTPHPSPVPPAPSAERAPQPDVREVLADLQDVVMDLRGSALTATEHYGVGPSDTARGEAYEDAAERVEEVWRKHLARSVSLSAPTPAAQAGAEVSTRPRPSQREEGE